MEFLSFTKGEYSISATELEELKENQSGNYSQLKQSK